MLLYRKDECIEIQKIENRNKNLIINDSIFLKKEDKLEFSCSCGAKIKQQFRFKEKFLNLNFICSECQKKQTNLEKYGTEYGLQNKAIREKIKQTNLERYGVEWLG